MNIMRNDKVILTKAMGNLQIVGETFEVANVTETAVVLRNAINKVAVGAIDIDMFDQYFKKPEEVKGWTPWQRLVDHIGNTIAFYRTNWKKVQVRTADGVRGEAACSKCDEFNLYFGLNLAMNRCEIKVLSKMRSECSTTLKQLNDDISAKKDTIKNLINSLNKTEK